MKLDFDHSTGKHNLFSHFDSFLHCKSEFLRSRWSRQSTDCLSETKSFRAQDRVEEEDFQTRDQDMSHVTKIKTSKTGLETSWFILNCLGWFMSYPCVPGRGNFEIQIALVPTGLFQGLFIIRPHHVSGEQWRSDCIG